MSTINVRAVLWAANQVAVSASAQLVLLHLAAQADVAFTCHVSVRSLADKIPLGHSTIRRAVAELQRHRLLTLEYQFHGDGAQGPSRYYLNHPRAPHLSKRKPAADSAELFLPLDLEGGLPASRGGAVDT